MLKRLLTILLVGISACLFLVAQFLVTVLGAQPTPSALADTPATGTRLEQPLSSHIGLAASDVSSAKISQFVQVYLQVVALIERREGDLQAAETETESFQMQQEIEQEAFALMEAAGLTAQEYLQLLGLANTDPDFGERIATQIQEAMN